MRTIVIALCALLAACERPPTTVESAVLEAAKLAPGSYVKGQAWLDACRGEAGSGESCYWFHRQKPAACAGGACDKLIVFFVGGEMSCASSFANEQSGYAKLAKSYADAGYAFACAQLFETNQTLDTATPVAVYQEAPRVDLLVKEITAKTRVLGLWNGKKLLHSGVSHGAEAAVLAMRHTDFDQDPAWHGTAKTGACFFDGIYDVIDLEDWMDGSNACTTYRNQAYCRRYGEPDGCATADTPDRRMDSLVSARTNDAAVPGDFAVTNWKLVECGSGMARNSCNFTGDMVPKAQQATLCGKIRSDGTRSCAFASFPKVGHNQCIDSHTSNACRAWFDGL